MQMGLLMGIFIYVRMVSIFPIRSSCIYILRWSAFSIISLIQIHRNIICIKGYLE